MCICEHLSVPNYAFIQKSRVTSRGTPRDTPRATPRGPPRKLITNLQGTGVRRPLTFRTPMLAMLPLVLESLTLPV